MATPIILGIVTGIVASPTGYYGAKFVHYLYTRQPRPPVKQWTKDDL